ncbi:MAG: N-acetylmuramoyl-L-alanine amidase [Chlorobiaceae bacterium]|nr:N-acetylmuramoyl-L-alanine amidase [Chlorobiaceae bacterium]
MRPLYVILDNGHGQDTPGKRSPVWPDGTQLFEYEFNRAIVNRVVVGLQKAGIHCTRLVPEQHDVSITERIIRANRMIAAANRDGYQCILISVHGNAGGGTGFEVLTSVGKTISDDLAELFYQLAETVFLKNFPMRRDRSDGDSDKETDQVSILPKTNCPAVLTENLFMDTRKDCQLMQSSFGRDMIAEMHVEAIKKYKEKYAC